MVLMARARRSSVPDAAARSSSPPSPPAVMTELREDVHPLGEALKARADDVLALTVQRAAGSVDHVDPLVHDRFEKINRGSTLAVARWIAGEGADAAIASGRETWVIYGELAARRTASLNQLTKRCIWWRDAVAEVLRKSAAELDGAPEALAQALTVLQLSLEFSLVRMSKVFDSERQKIEEELAKRERELSFLATHDGLTGLPNRTLILDRAEQMIARSLRSKGRVTALFVDIDNFKTVNDTFGHQAGDQLLQGVAERLDGVVRGSDALGRLGGDEFVMVCEEGQLDAGPGPVAERVLEALKPAFKLGKDGETSFVVSVSIGIAVGERTAAEELLRQADIAMYHAKWEGKNRFSVFEARMLDTLEEQTALEIDLRLALERDEFFLAYQPTLALSDMSATGLEALIRWAHPERGTIAPDEFIPLAEEMGLITEIGRWVLETACSQGAHWRAAGHQVGIAVNVSAGQLDSDQLIEDIEAALARSGLDAASLTIEITETTLMRNIEETARRLAAIKSLGVRIAIDDFGTGYSSLAHLQRFPVDALKIDRSFIAGLSRNKEGEALIHTLVQLGKALSIETLAEGIEEAGQLSTLRDEECDSGQGFLLARPLDAKSAEAFIESRRTHTDAESPLDERQGDRHVGAVQAGAGDARGDRRPHRPRAPDAR
ncbi:MAG: putative bifunctional diguanylate cyclase/phosphodiesterase [Solirubrobacteraceae bacterium]